MATTGRGRGFNASAHGFTTASPVAVTPDNPDNLSLTAAPASAPTTEVAPVSDLSKTLDAYGKLLGASTEVELKEPVQVPERQRVLFKDMPEETQKAAVLVGSSFGMPKENVETMLSEVDMHVPHTDNEAFDFIPADTAAAFASQCVGSREGDASGQKLVDDIRDGKVLLTRRELVMMAGLRDAIMEVQSLDAMDYADDSVGWIPMTEQRNCELCGQFIGLRTSHVNCFGGVTEETSNTIHTALDEAGWNAVDNLPEDMFIDGADVRFSDREDVTRKGNVWKSSFSPKKQRIRKPLGLSDDMMQDLYCRSVAGATLFRLTVGDVLYSYLEKPKFGGELKLSLPAGVRRAFVETPAYWDGSWVGDTEWDSAHPTGRDASTQSDIVANVAALIDPPFASHEIEHMIDVGGAVAVDGLLKAKRTRAETLRILSNYPSDAGALLSYMGRLPESTISNMIDSPDERVQREAAVASNLTDDQIERLASSPYPDVRKALIDTRYGYSERTTTPAGETLPYSLPQQLNELYKYKNNRSKSLNHSSVLHNHPAMLGQFIGDREPDESVARLAATHSPLDRQFLQAVTQISSPVRLNLIRAIVSRRSGPGKDPSPTAPLILQYIDSRIGPAA